MLYLPFTFRVSTKEEIEFFSERFSNVYARNPKVKLRYLVNTKFSQV